MRSELPAPLSWAVIGAKAKGMPKHNKIIVDQKALPKETAANCSSPACAAMILSIKAKACVQNCATKIGAASLNRSLHSAQKECEVEFDATMFICNI